MQRYLQRCLILTAAEHIPEGFDCEPVFVSKHHLQIHANVGRAGAGESPPGGSRIDGRFVNKDHPELAPGM